MAANMTIALACLGILSGFISGVIGLVPVPALVFPCILLAAAYIQLPDNFFVIIPVAIGIGVSSFVAAMIGRYSVRILTPRRLQLSFLVVLGLVIGQMAYAHVIAAVLPLVLRSPQVERAAPPDWLIE